MTCICSRGQGWECGDLGHRDYGGEEHGGDFTTVQVAFRVGTMYLTLCALAAGLTDRTLVTEDFGGSSNNVQAALVEVDTAVVLRTVVTWVQGLRW